LINSRLISTNKVSFGVFIALWAFGQGMWGYYANAFENGGEPTLLGIQVANFLWLFINMGGCLLFLANQDLHLQADFTQVTAKKAVKTSD